MSAGANVNAQDLKSGWTALMQATYFGQVSLTSLAIHAKVTVWFSWFHVQHSSGFPGKHWPTCGWKVITLNIDKL